VTDRQILVVDDDTSILEAVSELLKMEGYSVCTAADGRAALAEVEDKDPLLVLLDMRMPVLDGWGFVEALAEQGRDLPIIVMTAAKDAKAWAQEVGAVAHLEKPFDISALLAVIDCVSSGGQQPR
jgi:two-component system, chemotaxis family, chemotaxis protein CheY